MRDPALLRTILMFVPIVAGLALWHFRKPPRRAQAGILLALLWNAVGLLALNLIAVRAGWWAFDVLGGTLLGVPIDLLVGWSALWTALATVALPRWPLALVIPVAAAAGLWLDWLLMPLAEPVVVLGDRWLVGEAASLALCLVPGALLARWTADDRALPWRVAMQVSLFAAVMLWVIPQVIFEYAGGGFSAATARPGWLNVLALQLVLAPAVVGIAAVQEFMERGGGTPLPLDAPRRLVTSGPYRYVANPMQVSMVLVCCAWGLFLESWVIALCGVMAVAFGVGIGRWATEGQLERRFGRRWSQYRAAVRAWRPAWRPRPAAEQPPARLYIDSDCVPCRGVGRWLDRRAPVALEIVPAAAHPSGRLTRMTYEAALEGAPPFSARGVAAFARALEHVHLGWALAGWVVRLPVLCGIVQVLVDAVGGGPRRRISAAKP